MNYFVTSKDSFAMSAAAYERQGCGTVGRRRICDFPTRCRR